jgi:hypothetical protein
MRLRRQRGSLLISTIVSASLGVIVIGAAAMVVQGGSGVARSAAVGDTATRRTARALAAFADAVRSGSLSQVRRVDGTAFADGTTDDGISGRRVIGYSGTPVLGTRFTLKWVADPSGTRGDLLREQDGLTELVASGVERFQVTRNGDTFSVATTTRLTAQGSMERVARGSVKLTPRNP